MNDYIAAKYIRNSKLFKFNKIYRIYINTKNFEVKFTDPEDLNVIYPILGIRTLFNNFILLTKNDLFTNKLEKLIEED